MFNIELLTNKDYFIFQLLIVIGILYLLLYISKLVSKIIFKIMTMLTKAINKDYNISERHKWIVEYLCIIPAYTLLKEMSMPINEAVHNDYISLLNSITVIFALLRVLIQGICLPFIRQISHTQKIVKG